MTSEHLEYLKNTKWKLGKKKKIKKPDIGKPAETNNAIMEKRPNLKKGR